MHHRYLLCALTLPLFLHGMNQVEVKLQVAQEINNLDDSVVQVVISVPQLHTDKRYKLMLPNKESLELSSLHLEHSGYFVPLLQNKSESEIPLDKGPITTLQGLQELGEILRIIVENTEDPAQGLLKFLFADDLSQDDKNKRGVYLYELAMYYDIKPLQAVLIEQVKKMPLNIELRLAIAQLPEAWQKELIARKVNSLLKFYTMPSFSSTGYSPFINSLGWLSHNQIIVRTDLGGLQKWHLISNEITDVSFDEEEDALMPLLQERSWDVLLSEQMRCFTAHNRLIVVNPVDNKCLLDWYAPRYIKNIAASPDKSMLACGCIEGSVYIFDTSSWKCLYELEAHVEHADIEQDNALAWSANGTLLASGSGRTVNVWDIPCLKSIPVKLTVAQLNFLESRINFPHVPWTEEDEAIYNKLPSVWKKLVDDRLNQVAQASVGSGTDLKING